MGVFSLAHYHKVPNEENKKAVINDIFLEQAAKMSGFCNCVRSLCAICKTFVWFKQIGPKGAL